MRALVLPGVFPHDDWVERGGPGRRGREEYGRGAESVVALGVFVTEPFDDSQDEDGSAAIGGAAAQTLSVKGTAGTLDALTGNTVALPDTVAVDLHRNVGDRILCR